MTARAECARCGGHNPTILLESTDEQATIGCECGWKVSVTVLFGVPEVDIEAAALSAWDGANRLVRAEQAKRRGGRRPMLTDAQREATPEGESAVATSRPS